MSYVITITDPVMANQSKYYASDGLRYSADNSEVYPGAARVRPNGTRHYTVDSIEEARDATINFVTDRMTAFGKDRQALHRSGYTAAKKQALDLSADGGKIRLTDNWLIEVVRA